MRKRFGLLVISATFNLDRLDVVGIGAATLDDLWLVPDFSDHERVTPAVQHLQMGGGPVATALCVLGSLGRKVTLLDTVGDDAAGQLILEGLQRNHVSTVGIAAVAVASSARAVILVRQSDGARQIAYLPSSAGELSLDARQRELILAARMLHLNGRHETAAREAVELASAAGVWVSFDGGAGRYRDSLRDLVLKSQIRIVSRQFAQCFCGCEEVDEMLRLLMASPAEVVVITDGIRGSWVALPDGTKFHQPAYSVEGLVDTTGCGDVYHGAFLHGWLEKWPASSCADFASKLAAQNACGLGGRSICQELLSEGI
ncbi:MAG TPA: carbohydrate kinase family protein [Verrucomicrobiales bacterium]|nr:carbohydrate kinase family protein [Verrucomicrobiales bacterium]